MEQLARFAQVFAVLLVSMTATAGAEIKVLSLPPLRSAMSELLPKYEQSSGNKVTIEYGTPPQLLERLQRGDAADVLIMTKQDISRLQQQDKIEAGSPHDVARVGMGVFVRKGGAKLKVGSVETLKRALLTANSIAYIDPASGAPGGIYLAQLFERLGIAADLKQKTRHFGPSGAETAVASGEVELGLSQVTVIVASPGIELVGSLPPEVQNHLQFTTAVMRGAKQAAAAKGFIEFITSPIAAAAMKAKGYE